MVHYPLVDVSELDEEITRRLVFSGSGLSTPLSIEEFGILTAQLAPILDPDRPMMPGAVLGPFQGTADGPIGDFAWPDPWTPLVKTSVFHAMLDEGLEVRGAPADIHFKCEPTPLIELEALPSARAHSSLGIKLCEICGLPTIWGTSQSPKKTKIAGTTYDESKPMQRIFELPGCIVVNQALEAFVRQQKLTNIELEPIAIA